MLTESYNANAAKFKPRQISGAAAGASHEGPLYQRRGEQLDVQNHTLNPKPQILNPLNRKPEALNPKP